MTRAEMDVRPGGRYRIAFHTPDGEQHDVAGVYREVVRHRKLAFAWAWNGTPERVSLVTIELQPVAAGTQLSFLHENFFDLAARDNHERGWNATFVKLDALLAEAA